jgi:DNA-binding Lrp family transcriptional regulator
LKDLEQRLVSELMKNSRRSDRQLAKALGVSQPTVTRTIHKLENEGYIKEYTIVPDFQKLGYELMAFTFFKMRENLKREEQNRFLENVKRFLEENPHAELIGVKGIGLKKDYAFVSFFKNYSSFAELQRQSKSVPYSDLGEHESFLVDLKDQNNRRILTMSTLADHVLASTKEKTEPTKT